MAYIKWYLWFIKESQSFMCSKKDSFIYKSKVFLKSLKKGIKFSKDCVEWERLKPKQREDWYLSGEGRLIEFN